MPRVSIQVLSALHLCQGLDCRDKGTINDFAAFDGDLCTGQRLVFERLRSFTVHTSALIWNHLRSIGRVIYLGTIF